MKKMNLLLSAVTLFGLLSFAGCVKNENSSTNSSTLISSTDTSEKHTVKFVYNDDNNGESTRNVKHNALVYGPLIEREYYKLEGWYTDPNLVSGRWNFEKDVVTEDITLYANWEVDFENWVWRLGRQASKSTIMLKVTHYKKYDANTGKYSEMANQGFGSGVIFAKKDGYYYALTNNHVVSNSAKNDDGMDVMITTTFPHIVVYDHYINPYTAELILSMNTYDLALVRFKTESDDYEYSPSGSMIDPDYIDAANKLGAEEDYNNYQVKVAKFADEDPKIGANVSSYGAPIAQPGVCTIGTVSDYRGGCIYDHQYSSSYIHEFDVIYHTASILSGNSGGPLFDVNLNIAGINYGSSGINDTYTTGGVFWAIPISKVREFLDVHVVANTKVNTNGQYTFLGEY